jgi:hypothetical protein
VLVQFIRYTVGAGFYGGTISSSNTSVALATYTGGSTATISGVGAGVADITYTYAGTDHISTVTVNPAPNAGTVSGSNVCIGSTSAL